MANQLNDFISHEGLLIVNQSAYKSSHSTETALLKIQNDIAFSMDSGKAMALTLLDLSAAFDTIDHSLLYDCLHDLVQMVLSCCGSNRTFQTENKKLK